jgi:phage terminase large subunit-like protein
MAKLSTEVRAQLRWHWHFWARSNQLAPDGQWSTWLVQAGRGFGKTEAGAQWVRQRVKDGARNIALVAETQKDLGEVMVARLMAISPQHEQPSACAPFGHVMRTGL